MTDRRSSLTQEEDAKLQQYWGMADASDADIDSEEEWILHDQCFPTPAEAKTYNNWWRKSLMQLLNSGFHPHIPIGHRPGEIGIAYRLVPNTGYLEPTKEMNWKHNSNKVVLPAMVLGVNHTVQLNKPVKGESDEELEAINRCIYDDDMHSSDEEGLDIDLDKPVTYARLANKVRLFDEPGREFGKFGRTGIPVSSSDHASSQALLECTRSGDSTTTTNDSTGFVFYQLGALHYCRTLSDPTTTNIQKIFAKDWFSSNYIVVAKIDRLGWFKDIWLIWDFWR